MGQQASTAQDKFPYKPINEVQSSPKSGPSEFRWTLWDGIDVKDDKKQVSIFCFEPSTHPLAQSAFKRFKTIRHPNTLAFLHGVTVEEENKTYVVTERVEPLSRKIVHVSQLPESIPWGIYQICKASQFLNKDCNLVHGNINLSTIYVTSVSDWKLGGFEFISSIEDVKNGRSPLYSSLQLTSNIQPPPELQAPIEKALPALTEAPNGAIDSWLIGCLIWAIYNHSTLSQASSFDRNHLKDMSHIPSSIKDEYVKLLSGAPRNRYPIDKLLDSPFFNSTFVQTCLFLEHLNIKDNFEKEKFFKTLGKCLDQFPDSMAKYKILPTLITALDFGSADHHVLPVLLSIASKLSPEEFKSQVTNSVLKWFSAPDRSLRITLLSNLDIIIPHLDSNQVSNTIWTPLSQGFTDGVPQLRELTVKSLLQFAPKLNEKVINGDMLKFLATLQVDAVAGIRCNTTVCLGKLAHYLTPAVRQKVLLQAFARAIKDPFPPSRQAAVAALCHCHNQGFFSASDIATKIVPFIAPLALDMEMPVRQASLSALHTFVKYLEENSSKLPATAAPNPNDSPATASSGHDNSSASSSASSGMLDWAIGKVLGSEPTSTPSKAVTTANVPASNPSQMTSVSSNSNYSHNNTINNKLSTDQSRPKQPQHQTNTTSGVHSHNIYSSSTATPNNSSNRSSSNNLNDVPWDEDEAFSNEPEVPTSKGKTTSSTASNFNNSNNDFTSPHSKPSSFKSSSSSSSLEGWGDTPSWDKPPATTPASKIHKAPSSSDWDTKDQWDSSPAAMTSSNVSSNSSSKGAMSLKTKSNTALLNGWEDDSGSGWETDFPTPLMSSQAGRINKRSN